MWPIFMPEKISMHVAAAAAAASCFWKEKIICQCKKEDTFTKTLQLIIFRMPRNEFLAKMQALEKVERKLSQFFYLVGTAESSQSFNSTESSLNFHHDNEMKSP